MTGAEHWRVAETLLANLRSEVAGNSGTPLYTPDHQHRILSEALVHATLALTAATLATSNRRLTDADDWAEAMS